MNNAFRVPDVEFRPDGLSIELNPRASDQANGGVRRAWIWSFSFNASPITTIELKEEQISDADAAARRGADCDEVARQLNPQYASRGTFEQRLYRQTLQTSVEHRPRYS